MIVALVLIALIAFSIILCCAGELANSNACKYAGIVVLFGSMGITV